MCGIVGAVAQRKVVPLLLEGLKRLEYRGYDSAGLAVVDEGLQRIRCPGRVADLEARAREARLRGRLGIAHTRWATHGAPTERNAHPQVSGPVAVVHNGIVENHESLRCELKGLGYEFTSDTDTEVVAHLVHAAWAACGDLLQATREAVARLQGAYALGVICAESPGQLVCARRGSPLLIGIGIEEHFIASDAAALLPVTSRVVYLEDGDVADIGLLGYRIWNAEGREVGRPVQFSQVRNDIADLGHYRHYMQKEIHEQPRALADTLEAALVRDSIEADVLGPGAADVLAQVRHVHVLACGTSCHAGWVARHWVEAMAGIPCSVEVASEYRYRDSAFGPDTLVVTISQSGETADTLAALEHARAVGHQHFLAVCNVAQSALMRQSGLRFLTRAGPEIGVASTKAFTTQLAALFVLALLLAKARGRLSDGLEQESLGALRDLPAVLQRILSLEEPVAAWAERIAGKQHALFLGRGLHYPIAMEGALKLKEISYIHAEAYPAGELKHGPLALVDKDMPVLAIAPRDGLLEKLKSNLHEVRARGGELYVLADGDSGIAPEEGVHVISVPEHPALLSPIVYTLPLQLLAYHAALHKGTDVDKPRNLAKSVTVE